MARLLALRITFWGSAPHELSGKLPVSFRAGPLAFEDPSSSYKAAGLALYELICLLRRWDVSKHPLPPSEPLAHSNTFKAVLVRLDTPASQALCGIL